MTTANVQPQPHEYEPGKLEAVLANVKNLSAEKIDLVVQRLRQPMQSEERDVVTYFLRYWKLAEREVSLQQIPMTGYELGSLGAAIARLEKTQKEKAEKEGATPHTFRWSPGESTWSAESDAEPERTTARVYRTFHGDATFRGSLHYKGKTILTRRLKSEAEVFEEMAAHIRAYPQTLKFEDQENPIHDQPPQSKDSEQPTDEQPGRDDRSNVGDSEAPPASE